MTNTNTDRARTVAFLLAVSAISVALTAIEATVAEACGHCHGDKVAAVYDHEVLQKAKREGKHVAYAEVIGAVPDDMLARDTLRSAIAATAGIDKSSIRVSSNPAAVAFAFAPKGVRAEQLLERISKKLSGRQWSLKLLKTVE
jgi:hypothetical protein